MENSAVKYGTAGYTRGVSVVVGIEWNYAMWKMRLILKGLLSHAKELGLYFEGQLEVMEGYHTEKWYNRAEFMRRLDSTVTVGSVIPVKGQ